MNEYSIHQESPTISSILLVGATVFIAGSAIAPGSVAASRDTLNLSGNDVRIVEICESSNTAGQLLTPYADEDNNIFDFEGELMSFYTKLLSEQEALGEEFEGVLHENIWDLYIRT
jgi:hypothetical protein